MFIWIYLIIFGSFISKPCLFYDVQNEATGSTDLSKQTSPDNLLLFSTLDGTLTAVDKNDGKVRWKHQDEPAVKVPVDTKQAINPIVLPDPKDGSLYLLGGAKTDSLKKLPFTIPELVASAPCRSSDGIFYTGKKTDQWFLVEPRTGQREPVLGWNSNPVDANTCPLVPGSGVYIGRTQYEILMLDVNNESKRKWNVTFFGYAAEPMPSDMRVNYEMIHFSTSSTGMLITMDRISGKMLWKLDLGSPVVAVYLLTLSGLVSVPFTSVAHQTLPMLEKANPYSHKMRLYPTLYIGEHIHGLYALPSLVDQTAVTITASQTSPLLLEGPSVPNENQDNDYKSFPLSGQNIIILPDDLDKLYDSPNLRHIFMDKNSKIYLGHYNVPEFSSVQLRLSSRQFDEKVLKQPVLDSENESNVDIVKSPSEKRSVEVQTDGTEEATENLKHSTTFVLSYYWYAKTWLNKQENIGLKIALIIVVGCMISMFWYFKAQVREFQQMSQGSTGSAYSQNGPVTAYLEELNDGQLRVGKIIFRPDVVLGRGCEGTCVYKGEFEGRAVAVKRILPEYFSLADREVSLLKESDAHPHVIRYHCTERDRQFRYIALELCVATLYDYVLKKDQIVQVLPKISEMDILKQATSGIAYLHSLDIVHRDIKPQNVLLWVGPSGAEVRALISDFGLCKKLQIGRTSFSRRSGITGTDGWIAPEMLNGNFKTTTAVDMFSLGCVFYFVLSAGKHPFGEPLRRQANILSDAYQLNDLLGPENTQELAKNLIVSLIVSIPTERPPAEAVLKHPVFWNRTRILTFFQDVSDRVEKADNFDEALLSLEKYANSVVKSDWRIHVSNAVALDLRRFRTYRGESVRDLLRALRNKKHHYHELPKEAQDELGEIPDNFVEYWILRFPQLLLHTWLAMQCVKHEPSFTQYYHSYFIFPNNLCKNLLVDDSQDEINFYLENISRKKPDNLKNKSKKLLVDVPIKNFDYTTKIDTKDKLKNLNYDWRQTINDSNGIENVPYKRRTNNNRSRKNRKSIGESSPPVWKLSTNQES